MKPDVKPAALFLCLALPFLSPGVLAAPRVGTHGRFTRVVFSLPLSSFTGAGAISTSLSARHVTVKLKPLSARAVFIRAEQGSLAAPGVRAYAVKGNTVTLALSPGYRKATAKLLAGQGKQPARLIIDVPRQQAAARASAAEARSASIRTSSSGGRSAVSHPHVVIDPGHGGVDPGMQSQWVREEEVTLDVGLRVRDLLRAKGVDAVMTRDTDRDLSADKATDLDLRSNMAKTDRVAAYISIHVNASDSDGAEGIETYYFGQPLSGHNRSLAVAENGGGSVGHNLTRKAANTAQTMLGDILAQAKVAFSRQLAQKVQSRLLTSTGAVNRGVHTDAFYVIRDPRTAAILTEIGFGSSKREGPRLATPAYRAKIANGIAQAILDFLHVG